MCAWAVALSGPRTLGGFLRPSRRSADLVDPPVVFHYVQYSFYTPSGATSAETVHLRPTSIFGARPDDLLEAMRVRGAAGAFPVRPSLPWEPRTPAEDPVSRGDARLAGPGSPHPVGRRFAGGPCVRGCVAGRRAGVMGREPQGPPRSA